MSMDLYVVFCIFSVDREKKENLMLSADSTKSLLPIMKIEYPKLLYNEIRYHIKNMLCDEDQIIDTIKDIPFSYIEIQNSLCLQYIEEEYKSVYNTEKDMFLLCSIILDRPHPLNKNFSWKKFNFIKSFDHVSTLNSMVDYIVSKSIL